MPVMNGAELIRRVRAVPALDGLPVLLMTAAMPSASTPIPEALEVLSKPFELDTLLDAVARLCPRAA